MTIAASTSTMRICVWGPPNWHPGKKIKWCAIPRIADSIHVYVPGSGNAAEEGCQYPQWVGSVRHGWSAMREGDGRMQKLRLRRGALSSLCTTQLVDVELMSDYE